MITAIQLNDKHFLQTGKVSNILSNDVLSTKSNAKLLIAKIEPQQPLSLSRVIPILLSKLPQQRILNHISRMPNTTFHTGKSPL